MDFYLYAKSEVVPVVKPKIDLYKTIMRVIWFLILLTSSVNNVFTLCVWVLNISIPTWLCGALLVNVIASYKAWEVLGAR